MELKQLAQNYALMEVFTVVPDDMSYDEILNEVLKPNSYVWWEDDWQVCEEYQYLTGRDLWNEIENQRMSYERFYEDAQHLKGNE